MLILHVSSTYLCIYCIVTLSLALFYKLTGDRVTIRFTDMSNVFCTGLDSTTAMHLVATLRQLAQGGRAILTTIHQPSSRLYQMLDKLLLLSEGYASSACTCYDACWDDTCCGDT